MFRAAQRLFLSPGLVCLKDLIETLAVASTHQPIPLFTLGVAGYTSDCVLTPVEVVTAA